MRQIKYLQPIFRILIIILLGVSLHYFETFAIYSVILMIILDFIIQISINARIKSKIRTGELVHIGRKSYVYRVINVIFLVVICYYLLSQKFYSPTINLNIIGIIGIAYFTLSELIFSKYFHGFILDKNGVVQPEIYNKSYNWKDIDGIELSENEISMNISSKNYRSAISKNQMSQISSFLKGTGINYSA